MSSSNSLNFSLAKFPNSPPNVGVFSRVSEPFLGANNTPKKKPATIPATSG
jgi:hypothetical protein